MCLIFLLFGLLLCVALTVLGVASLGISVSLSGVVNKTSTATKTDDSSVVANPSVPVAQPGVLAVHTTNSTGSLTMTNSGHGIVTGQRFDLYWSGGHCYGAVAGTVAGLTVPIASVSGGDNLPAAATPVTVGIATSAPFNAVGANMTAMALVTPQNGYFVFADGGGDLYAAYVTAGFIDTWKMGDVRANPLVAGTPTKVWMSHDYVTAAVGDMTAAAITH
jgi:hypothetical protein